MADDTLACPECGAPMVLRETAKYRYPNGDPRRFYGCSRWPSCDGIHGAHPDGTPLGIPADKPTKAARIVAHAAFDSLWKGGAMKRRAAYRWMQQAMNLPEAEAHISMFDAAQCAKLATAVHAYLTREDALR